MTLTDGLALYGAVVSTVVATWTVLQSRPWLKVDLVPGRNDTWGDAETGLYIFVRNDSAHAVQLAAVEVEYLHRRPHFGQRLRYFWTYRRLRRVGWVSTALPTEEVNTGCPRPLGPRSTHRVFLSDAVVKRLLADATEPLLIATVQDVLWHNTYSRPYRVHME